MTDDLTVSGGSSAGSPDTAPSSEDERIKGFQRAISEKAKQLEESQRATAALQARIEALELSQMSEPERLSLLSQREQSRVREMEAELERLKLAQKFPKVAPHFETIYKATSAEEQMRYLDALLNPSQSSTGEELSDVDPNNPMRSPDEGISVPPGSILTEADADRVLKMWGNRPMKGR